MAFDPIQVGGTDPVPIASCGDYGDDWIIFEVTNLQGGFQAVPQSKLNGSPTDPADIGYYDMLADHKVTIAKGTPITNSGVYGVFCPAMSLALKPTAGSCTVYWQVPR